MSMALLQTALLLPLEFLINRVLALDSTSKQQLKLIEGKSLALHCTQPAAVFYLSVRNSALHLSSIHQGETTASLHGSASAMLGLLLRREKTGSLHSLKLELRGDTAFVQTLQTLLLELDLDWEYQLSRIIGDIPTSLMSSGLQDIRSLLQRSGSKLKEDATEFLHEETGLFPVPAELEAFYAAVSALVQDVDRLQARINQLE
jgi:ubiquinone biosynthesis protein UbiJ